MARRIGETVDQVQKRFAALHPVTGTAATQTKALTAAMTPANEQLTRLASIGFSGPLVYPLYVAYMDARRARITVEA